MPELKELRVALDAETLDEAERLFKALDLDLETACRLFIRQALRERGLPFAPHLAPGEPLAPAEAASPAPEKAAPKEKEYTDVFELLRDLEAGKL